MNDKVKIWSGKIFRHFLVFFLAVIATMFITMKYILPDFQKKITNQQANQIVNQYTTVVSEPRGSLFNSDNDLLWGFFGIKLRLGKPVREKLNGEQSK